MDCRCQDFTITYLVKNFTLCERGYYSIFISNRIMINHYLLGVCVCGELKKTGKLKNQFINYCTFDYRFLYGIHRLSKQIKYLFEGITIQKNFGCECISLFKNGRKYFLKTLGFNYRLYFLQYSFLASRHSKWSR